MTGSIKINIQIRAVKLIAAIGTDYLAILFVHLGSTTVADPNSLLIPFDILEQGLVKLVDSFPAQAFALPG